jgi:hypothetical protein
VFANMVRQNAEGTIVTSIHGTNRIAFNEENVTRLLAEKTFAPAGAGCLALAWQHRDLLLER